MKTIEPIQPPQAQLWPMSVTAYRALGEAGLIPKNTELLYGQIYRKMSKSPLHSALVRRLLKWLQSISLPGRFVTSEQPLTCHDSEPEPDVAIVRGAEDEFWHEHPRTAELVIEVCVSSHEYDAFKLRAYAEAEVREVWLVHVPEKQVKVHRLPESGRYREEETIGPGGRLSSASVPEFKVALDALFERPGGK